MSDTKVVHIIGIGGIGMSAIAEILHNLNYKVQGSDVYLNSNINRLKKLGVKVYIGHSTDNINQAQVIIYSSAIKFDNVELIAAKEMNKVIVHRSEILAELTQNKYTIAVSGSSGKTTTTAMIASIFDHANIEATVVVGGILNSYQSNAKSNKSNIFLLEADESDGTMLKIQANIAVITSINNDHIDYYGTFDDIKNAFYKFMNKADCAILPDSRDIKYSENNAITFGFENAHVRAVNIKQHADSIEFDVLNSISSAENTFRSLHNPLSFQCVTPECMKNIVLSNAVGIHKVSNALAAISVAIKLRIGEENIRKGLSEFKGVQRRFSTVADIDGVRLIEDYAHHPNEIHATLMAARSISKGKVIGIIELLRFARVRNFFSEFIKVFEMFDYVILTTVHPPKDEFISGYGIDDIQKALMSNGFNNVKIVNDSLLISYFINDFANSGDIVLFIGAGDNIAKLAKETAEFMIGVKQ